MLSLVSSFCSSRSPHRSAPLKSMGVQLISVYALNPTSYLRESTCYRKSHWFLLFFSHARAFFETPDMTLIHDMKKQNKTVSEMISVTFSKRSILINLHFLLAGYAFKNSSVDLPLCSWIHLFQAAQTCRIHGSWGRTAPFWVEPTVLRVSSSLHGSHSCSPSPLLHRRSGFHHLHGTRFPVPPLQWSHPFSL